MINSDGLNKVTWPLPYYTGTENLSSGSYGICIWGYADSDGGGGNPHYLFTAGSPTGLLYGPYIRRQNTGAVDFRRSSDGAQNNVVSEVSTAAGSMPLRYWTCIIAECSSTGVGAGSMSLDVNGVTATSSAGAGIPLLASGSLYLGRASTTLLLDGRRHKLLVVRRVFSATEKSELKHGRYPSTLKIGTDDASDLYFKSDLDGSTIAEAAFGYIRVASGAGWTASGLAAGTTEGCTLVATPPAGLPGLGAYYNASSGCYIGETSTTQGVEATGVGRWFDLTANSNTLIGVTGILQGWTTYSGADRVAGNAPIKVGDYGTTLHKPFVASGVELSQWNNQDASIIRIASQRNHRYQFGTTFVSVTLASGAADLLLSDGRISASRLGVSRISPLYANCATDLQGIILGSTGVFGVRGRIMASGGAALTSSAVTSGLMIGGGSYAGSDFADTSALLCYQRALDQEDINALNTWAESTYGFNANKTRCLIGIGSSTVQGIGSILGHTAFRQLPESVLNESLIINHGMGGTKYSDVSGVLSTLIDPLTNTITTQGLPNGTQPIVLAGINFNNDYLGSDAGLAGTGTLITNYNHFYEYCRARNCKVIAVMPQAQSNASSGAWPLTWTAYYNFLRSTPNKQAFLDLSDILANTNNVNSVNDGLHLSTSGYKIFADRLATAITDAENWSSTVIMIVDGKPVALNRMRILRNILKI
jgi:hypothetical protein